MPLSPLAYRSPDWENADQNKRLGDLSLPENPHSFAVSQPMHCLLGGKPCLVVGLLVATKAGVARDRVLGCMPCGFREINSRSLAMSSRNTLISHSLQLWKDRSEQRCMTRPPISCARYAHP